MEGPRCGDAAERPRIALLRTDCASRTAGLEDALAKQGAEVMTLPLIDRVAGDLRRFQPDTVLTGLCAKAPYRTLRVLRALGPVIEAPLVLLFISDLEFELLGPYMAAGVDDVVHPPHSASAILLRRYIHLHGPGRFDADAALRREVRLGSLLIDVPRRHVSGDNDDLELSGREFELLLQLVEAEGGVVSRTDLMQEIWGEEKGSEAVLDATVHRLRRKLDRAGREGGRVATIRGVGYQLDLSAN
jgi:DNA-binding response OmpR family regulator